MDIVLAEGFPKELYFCHEHDQLVTQRVQYDWTPFWCTKCAKFGHVVNNYKMGSKAANLQVDENGCLRKLFKLSIGSRVVVRKAMVLRSRLGHPLTML